MTTAAGDTHRGTGQVYIQCVHARGAHAQLSSCSFSCQLLHHFSSVDLEVPIADVIDRVDLRSELTDAFMSG